MTKKGNVLINGRTAVHADSQGTLTTVDVCWTRIGKVTVPIPYTNVARSADAAGTAATVFVNGRPVCHQQSIFSKSTGDEPGDRKGIRSGTITEKAEFITASPNVSFEGIPAVRQNDMMVSNNCNTAPMPLSQPGAAPARALDPEQVDEAQAAELPDRIDIGHAGEKTPLLKGLHRQSDAAGATTHQRLARYIDGDNPQRYRELVIGNLEAGKQHRLTLVLNDHQTDDAEPEDREYIVIPLGRTASVAKESPKPQKPAEYDNYTVPLILKRYATADFDKAKAKELRAGWLYIFCNGHLWRELQVAGEGFCKDVNLRRHQGKDFRTPSGEADSRVIVPWKIGGRRQTIEIAYSEVQWSWARINALGGMNPDTDYETRLKPGTALGKVSKKDAAARRSARMQDITDELEQWILSEGQETENIRLVDDVTADIYTLQLHKQSKLPVVFLQDPLGIALDNALAYQAASQELIDLVDAISKKPFYKSALLAYKLFFDPKRTLEQNHNPVWYQPLPKKTIFGECGDKTDKEKLTNLLEVGRRQKLRAKIRELKRIQIDWLQGKVEGESVTQPDFIDFNTAITDYFSGEGYTYLDGWLAMKGVLAGLDTDPCAIDGALDLSQDNNRPAYEDDPGCQYLEDLLRPSHPLHAMLFPTEQQAPVESDGPVQKTDPENDGMGNFRPAAYVAAFTGAVKAPGMLSQEARRSAELANQYLHDLLAGFSRQWENALKTIVDYDVNAFVRLSKLGNADLAGLRVMRLGDVTEEYTILHAGISKVRHLATVQAKGALRQSNAKLGDTLINIVDDADQVIGSESPRFLSKFKGRQPIDAAWDWTNLKKLKTKLLDVGELEKANIRVTVIPRQSDLVIKLNQIEAKVGVGAEVQAASLRALRKALPPVVVLFEIWNLHSVVTATQTTKTQKFFEGASALADLSYATLEGITQFLGAEKGLGKTVAEAGAQVGKRRILFLPALGSIAAFGSAAISLMDTVNNFGQNDMDAAVGHGIITAGFTAMGVILGGKALGIAAVAPFVPFLWVTVGLVALGVIIAIACDDTPLEEWAANGPFCKEQGAADFAHLRTDDTLAYNALANCLFTPRIEVKLLSAPVFNESQKGDIRVTVNLPNFTIGQDEVDLRAFASERIVSRSTMHLNPDVQVISLGPPRQQEPFIIRQRITKGRLTALEYYFHSDNLDGWQVKGRLFLAEGPTLVPDPVYFPKGVRNNNRPQNPARKPGETENVYLQRCEAYRLEQDTMINPDIPGWVYAEL